MIKKTTKQKWHRFKLMLFKPLHIIGWLFATMMGIGAPVYYAQLYEEYVYNLPASGMTKYEVSHYTQMISFSYQVAALVTVLLGYLCIKKLIKVIKAPGALKVYYELHPDEAKKSKLSYLWHHDINDFRTSMKDVKTSKTNRNKKVEK